jgi:integrase/recombinase XerD
MSTETAPVTSHGIISKAKDALLPVLVERAGSAARFAWDEFFFAKHHNPHTQKAYMAAVRRFLAWAEGQGVELIGVRPGMVGKYLVGLGGSASKRNLHLSALRGFVDRLVRRHVVVVNPTASVSGVKEDVIEGKTPEITLEQTRKLVAAIKTTYKVKAKGKNAEHATRVVGLRDRAILATMRFTAWSQSQTINRKNACLALRRQMRQLTRVSG